MQPDDRVRVVQHGIVAWVDDGRVGVWLDDYEPGRDMPTTFRVDEVEKIWGGDPAEVRPSDPRAGSQSGLNGPSGSPNSPPQRDHEPGAKS